MRIAAFGFRTLPPAKGAAGADKFALELFPRLVKRGHQVIAYNRRYPDVFVDIKEYKGVKIKTFKTVPKSGFDTLLHSFKCTCHIIFTNSADIVHIQNGGNSIWALPLRLFGKKVFISQDGVDWKRDKWPWYGKLYLKISAYITAYFPNQVIFDNVIARRLFEERFKKQFEFIPFGSEVEPVANPESVLQKFNLQKGGYYLFVGRFIPDKGLHYLIPAFKKTNTDKKLVLIGGSPNPSAYEKEILAMGNEQIVFPGFVYGEDVNALMLNAYCYIQPSDVEGLSPVVLTVMGLNVPLIVSDIEENQYVVRDTARTFRKGDIDSLAQEINYCEQHYPEMLQLAEKAQQRALSEFNWDKVTDDHVRVFAEN
ncbi:glycosyltransferase family 4 protein [Mucilaginibacter sp. RS28]|uniref:Glycosyltransferase family 4 protein n=1 Tax=Mucilaginibacter straminoryzae TaxID=2932774 RepID=A0A9X1X2H2_9SPHI|nr:glycosyltransferase family 4 protein [Mucilaginibacter straminoryzae]MCJ8209798.1 glycosyltransferase family 4 protein [Mucilaginibacter straminoryzae]